MRRLGHALALALIVTTSACSGHVADTSIAPGDRVRVTAPSIDMNRSVRTVAALETDTLVLNTDERANALQVPLADVTKLEVHRGKKSGARTGALIGLAFGGGVTLLASFNEDCADNCLALAFVSVPILGGATAGLGALIGLAIQTDRWEAVPLDDIRVGPSPISGDGVAVSVALRLR